jgi:hypothetical protein
VLIYKPWRRRIDRRRQIRHQPEQLQEDEELGTISGIEVAADGQEPAKDETSAGKLGILKKKTSTRELTEVTTLDDMKASDTS